MHFTLQINIEITKIFHAVRQLKYHEKKLLKKVDFLQWKNEANLRELQVRTAPCTCCRCFDDLPLLACTAWCVQSAEACVLHRRSCAATTSRTGTTTKSTTKYAAW